MALCVLFTAKTGRQFLDPDNLAEIARNFSEIGLMAIPQTFVVLTGGIDLSVGSILGVASFVIGAAFDRGHLSFPEAGAVSIAAGSVCGALNGVAVGPGGMPSLVVTLATLAIYRGLAVGFSGGTSVSDFPDSSSWIGQGTIGPFPTQLIVLAFVFAAATLALYRSPFGRYVFSTGYNETASRLAGAPVDRLRVWVFMLSGAAAGLAAVVHVARLGTARADAGAGMELDVISAVVLGGTDVAGGDGGLLGTFLALVILSVLRSGLNLLNVPEEGQSVVIGGLLIGTIALDRAVRRRR
ncbi:MAG: ABC transporter permease [Chloroflexi bacterium]|nr:ABC transporter permease [Chloroflexota bacterium]